MRQICIIFDLDETLISTTKRQFQIFKDFFSMNSLNVEFDYSKYLNLRRNFRLTNSEVYSNIVFNNELFNKFRIYYLNNIENLDYLSLDSLLIFDKNIIALKELMFKCDYKLVSLRSNMVNSLNQIEKIGLNHLFSEVLFLQHDLNANPKTKVIENLKEPYERIIFVGDALSDYEAACAANVEFIKVKSGLWDFEYNGIEFSDVNDFISTIKNYIK
jgi:phosphoglycolate phosphatase-like HAD superfamily hydrolase